MARGAEGEPIRQDYASLDDLVSNVRGSGVSRAAQAGYEFTHVHSASEAYTLAREGWSAELETSLAAAEDAIRKVETEHTLLTFVPTFDVSGCDVDVARYLSGEPECMVDYPLTPIVKAGRVITLCASISISAAVDTSSIIRRGQAITALALALSQLGYACEIYADLTGYSSGKTSVIRTRIKSAHDVTDPERIMFALAHPAMLRVFGFAAIYKQPDPDAADAKQRPRNPIEDLPDGTIYLPCLKSSRDVPDADTQLLAWLRQLEIVED